MAYKNKVKRNVDKISTNIFCLSYTELLKISANINPLHSFPYKPENEEKLTRMHQNLVKFDQTILQDLEREEGERKEVIQIREMVNVGLHKYNEFISKRKRK